MKIRFFIFLFAFTYSLISGYETYAQYSRSITATKTYTTSPGTITITDLADVPGFDPTNEIFAVANVDILIVGGGGGGGDLGGGGGGEVKLFSIDLNIGAQLAIAIGTGGTTTGNGYQKDGESTIVSLTSGAFSANYVALGGGGGGDLSNNQQRDGRQGGSGGGGGARNGNRANQREPGLGGSGVGPPNGNSGGDGAITSDGVNVAGGGAGGAGGAGTAGTTGGVGGSGGAGTSFAQFTGAFGAGGRGNGTSGNGTAGTGHGGFGSGGNAGSAGVSGVVIVQIVYRILPVEFLSFTAQYQSPSKSGLLEWKTAKEWENSHFEIERAVNSVKTWETVGRVEGNGYSDIPVDYTYLDNNLPSSGGNMFYRLKQVDYSGSFSYSVTKAIKVPSLLGSVGAWNTYPNPSTKGTEVKVALIQPGLYQDQAIYITLSNLLGQTKSYSTSSPEEISSIVSDWLNTSYSGLYVLDITWGNQRQQIKLIRN
jgi:hypothetical protein